MNAMLKPDSAEPVAAAVTPEPRPARRPRRPLAANTARARAQVSATALKIIAPLMGAALLVLVWQIITMKNSTFPTPAATLEEAVKLFSDPFYRNSPNDQGIGWNVLASCSAWAWASAWRRWWAFRWAS
jgi:nitrate/nitrite transport system permease protein